MKIYNILGAVIFLAGSIARGTAQEVTVPDTSYVELNEVVITGTRVAQKIIDIPYSVVRIDFQTFRYDRKIGAADFLSPVPGLFLQSRYGNHDVRFAIRGFGSRSNSGIRGIRILLDDIPESEPDGQTRIEALDFNSIGRIEIVKGNSSSLYTNAPGGVANFINDIDFQRSSVVQFNQFGSFGLHRNGIKAAVKTDHYRVLTTYSYQNYDGYREHNSEWWHILNFVLETTPSANTNLKILGYFVDGAIKLPGSLTKEEFEADPWQADQRSIDRDEKRITTKGRIGIRYNAKFGRNLNNEVEVTSFGTIKFFERTAKDYRIINRYGLGLSARYINRLQLGKRLNEFSFGGDAYMQPARTEYYDNISGTKGDQLIQLYSENIGNMGLYFTENFEIVPKKLFTLLTGRYDNISYHLAEETLPSRSDSRYFSAFTPKLALNYKVTPMISLYTSFGLSYDSPANNEMDAFNPQELYNDDLEAQESMNLELGIKGSRYDWEARFFRKLMFEATLFRIWINNEIIPFEVLGEVYYRNAAKTDRTGVELGGQVEIFKDFSLQASYTYSYFRYDEYSAMSVEIDSLLNFVETEKDFSGNFVPSVPRNNMYLGISYSHPLSRHFNVYGKASYMGISGLWVDDANSDETKSYNLLNAVVGFDMKFGGFNLMLSGGVNNIFDVVYVGFTNTNSANKRFYESGAPRDYFISLNLGYNF